MKSWWERECECEKGMRDEERGMEIRNNMQRRGENIPFLVRSPFFVLLFFELWLMSMLYTPRQKQPKEIVSFVCGVCAALSINATPCLHCSFPVAPTSCWALRDGMWHYCQRQKHHISLGCELRHIRIYIRCRNGECATHRHIEAPARV